MIAKKKKEEQGGISGEPFISSWQRGVGRDPAVWVQNESSKTHIKMRVLITISLKTKKNVG